MQFSINWQDKSAKEAACVAQISEVLGPLEHHGSLAQDSKIGMVRYQGVHGPGLTLVQVERPGSNQKKVH